MSEESIKNEQMRAYENSRIYNQPDMQSGMMNTQELMASFPSGSYEQQDAQMQASVYGGKSSRLQHVNAPKIVTQSDSYYKYNSGIYYWLSCYTCQFGDNKTRY